MQTLGMSSDNAFQIDTDDSPSFLPSPVTDPDERIKVIDIQLTKLGEEKKSALDDNRLLMNIIRQIERLSDERLVSLFNCWCEILTATDAMVQLLTFPFSPLLSPYPTLPPGHIIT
jgi:hypothetical protein